MSIGTVPTKPLTDKQGQYLAFIHAYSVVMGRAPKPTYAATSR